MQAGDAQDGGREMVEDRERVGLVLVVVGGGRERQRDVGVVGCDEGDGGVGEEAGEEGGEVVRGRGGQGVEGVEEKEGFCRGAELG